MSTKLSLNKVLPSLLLIPLLLGDLGRFRISNIYLNLSDIIVGCIAVVGFIFYIRSKNTTLHSYAKWLIGITCVLLVSLVLRIGSVPTKEVLAAALYPLRFFIYFSLPLFLVNRFKDEKIVKFTLRSLVISWAVISLCGILQILLLPNLQILEYLGYDPHYFRIVSTWLDPNFLGAGLVFILVLTLSLSSQYISPREKKICVALFAITLLFTFSRSAYIFALIAVGTFAILRKSWRIAGFLAAAILITVLIYIYPRTTIDTSRNIDRSFSANLRLKSYGEGIYLFLKNPLTGVGFNLVRYEKNANGLVLDTVGGGNSGGGIDSSWLLILATTGITGIIAFLAFWIRVGYFATIPTTATRKIFAWLMPFLKSRSTFNYAALAILLGWSIHAWFINSLFYANLMLMWQFVFSFALIQDSEK